MSQSHDPQSPLDDTRRTMNLALLVIAAYATSLEVFLRRGIGSRYLGWQAVGVLILVPLHAYALPRHRADGLTLFLVAYLVACVVQRLGMLWNHWRGMTVHSRYSGYPWLLESHVRMSETTFKTWIEPPFVALCAWGIQLYVDRLLGTYLLLAACALHLQCRLWTQQEHIQQLDLRDGWIEQQMRASRFRAEQEHLRG